MRAQLLRRRLPGPDALPGRARARADARGRAAAAQPGRAASAWRSPSPCRAACASSKSWSMRGYDMFRHRPVHRWFDWPLAARLRAAMTPDEYCQQKAAASGSSFYYSFLFLPPERRRAITALYAFCREVDDVVDECTDAQLARTKLAWWRVEVGKLFAGQAAASGHARRLQPFIEHFSINAEQLDEIIDGMEMDLDADALPRFCGPRALLLPRRRRGRPARRRHLRLPQSAHARVREEPRHRVPAHQHHPRRRRGRAQEPHLPADGRTEAVRASRPSDILQATPHATNFGD